MGLRADLATDAVAALPGNSRCVQEVGARSNGETALTSPSRQPPAGIHLGVYVSPIELIHHLVEQAGVSQKNLALAWLVEWNRSASKPLSIATAEPRLSNLMNDGHEGWKFFFADPRRAKLLFETLHADAGQRAALVEAATAKLAANAEARVVVDIHDQDGKVDAVLDALIRDVLTDRSLVPVVVLVTPLQYGQIPMAFAEQVRLVQVKSDADAAREIADRSVALVLSALPPTDADAGGPAFTRWAAIAWERMHLSVEPPDAMAIFARDGRLGDLRVVPSDERLDGLGIRPTEPAERLAGPALRRRMLAIADGSLAAPAAERLGEAAAYGIVASSTDEERVRAALEAAGLPTEVPADEAGLNREMGRAALRPVPATVLRVGATWHVINATAPDALRDHPGVHVHRFDASPTPLRRLAEVAGHRSSVEWELDPHLHGAIKKLDPTGVEVAVFAHARAWIIYGGHCAVVPNAVVCNGPERLAELLAAPPPPAELRLTQLRTTDGTKDGPSVYSLADPSALESSVWAQVPPVGDVLWHRREERLVAASIGQGRPMAEFHPEKHQPRDMHTPKPKSPWEGSVWEGNLLIPKDAPLDDDAWLDALADRHPDAPMERLRARHAAAAAEERHQRETLEGHRQHIGFPNRRDGKSDGDAVIRTSLRVCAFPSQPWSDLDLALAIAWRALRRALGSTEIIAVHDGRWLLPVAPGLIAELTFAAAPAGIVCRVAFERSVLLARGAERTQGWEWTTLTAGAAKTEALNALLSPLFGPVFGWESTSGHRVGLTMPSGLRVVGNGMSCAIRFVADPYGLAAAGPRQGTEALGAVAAVAGSE
jgi:hypothetical protein